MHPQGRTAGTVWRQRSLCVFRGAASAAPFFMRKAALSVEEQVDYRKMYLQMLDAAEHALAALDEARALLIAAEQAAEETYIGRD